MTDEEDRYGGTCDVCLSPTHRVWCEEGGGTKLTRPDNCTVGIDPEQFPAYVDPAGPLWNGAVVPGFSAAVADQVVAWLSTATPATATARTAQIGTRTSSWSTVPCTRTSTATARNE